LPHAVNASHTAPTVGPEAFHSSFDDD